MRFFSKSLLLLPAWLRCWLRLWSCCFLNRSPSSSLCSSKTHTSPCFSPQAWLSTRAPRCIEYSNVGKQWTSSGRCWTMTRPRTWGNQLAGAQSPEGGIHGRTPPQGVRGPPSGASGLGLFWTITVAIQFFTFSATCGLMNIAGAPVPAVRLSCGWQLYNSRLWGLCQEGEAPQFPWKEEADAFTSAQAPFWATTG